MVAKTLPLFGPNNATENKTKCWFILAASSGLEPQPVHVHALAGLELAILEGPRFAPHGSPLSNCSCRSLQCRTLGGVSAGLAGHWRKSSLSEVRTPLPHLSCQSSLGEAWHSIAWTSRATVPSEGLGISLRAPFAPEFPGEARHSTAHTFRARVPEEGLGTALRTLFAPVFPRRGSALHSARISCQNFPGGAPHCTARTLCARVP
jgi:hypothetical protein